MHANLALFDRSIAFYRILILKKQNIDPSEKFVTPSSQKSNLRLIELQND